jgi:hypothetical protein
MAKYLISFPSAAMVVPDGEWGAVGRDAHAVTDEAKAAGVFRWQNASAGWFVLVALPSPVPALRRGLSKPVKSATTGSG